MSWSRRGRRCFPQKHSRRALTCALLFLKHRKRRHKASSRLWSNSKTAEEHWIYSCLTAIAVSSTSLISQRWKFVQHKYNSNGCLQLRDKARQGILARKASSLMSHGSKLWNMQEEDTLLSIAAASLIFHSQISKSFRWKTLLLSGKVKTLQKLSRQCLQCISYSRFVGLRHASTAHTFYLLPSVSEIPSAWGKGSTRVQMTTRVHEESVLEREKAAD